MITKTEATSKLAQEEQAQYAMMEARIDVELREHDGRTFVDCGGVGNRVRERLMKAYRAAGWDR